MVGIGIAYPPSPEGAVIEDRVVRRALTILALALPISLGLAAEPAAKAPQPGTAVLTFRAQPAAQLKTGAWRIVRMSGGGERGEAILERLGTATEKAAALAELTRLAAGWAKAHPPAKLTVHPEGKLAAVTAQGRALGDLTAFLATLDLRMDAWGALASFTGFAVGTETDGLSLGLLRRDPLHGNLTASFTALREEKGAPVAEVTLRYPPGVPQPFIEKQLAGRTAAFHRATGATIAVQVVLPGEPRR
jgi:hypothetical protein